MIKNTAVISIQDTEFDEENCGYIAIENLEYSRISLEISTIENGKARLYFNLIEMQDILSSIKKAIDMIKSTDIEFTQDERKVVYKLDIKEANPNKRNTGFVIIEVFDKKRIGICISLLKGADPELWLDVNTAENLVLKLENAIEEALQNNSY